MVKNKKLLPLFVAGQLMLAASFPLYAQGSEGAADVATKDEMVPPISLSDETRLPVFAGDVLEGTYEIEVESSSSMFRIERAVLDVTEDSMSAVLTLSGKGYSKLFMGSGEQASLAKEDECSLLHIDENGKYSFTVSVDVLNQEIFCCAFSKKKNKWYERTVVFDASSLPEYSLLVPTHERQKTELKDGVYKVPFEFKGGTGRAGVENPARVTVKDGYAVAELIWSSKNYDYMRISGNTFKPLEKKETSVFEIPVYDFERANPVVADTVAMSQSHEINYWLKFDFDSAFKISGFNPWLAVGLFVAGFALVFAGVVCIVVKRRKS